MKGWRISPEKTTVAALLDRITKEWIERRRAQNAERVNELESGIIPLLEKEGNVAALKQSVNSFTRSQPWAMVAIQNSAVGATPYVYFARNILGISNSRRDLWIDANSCVWPAVD